MFYFKKFRKLKAMKYIPKILYFLETGMINNAIKLAKKSLKIYPKKEDNKLTKMDNTDKDFFSTIHSNLGAAYAKKRDYNQAINEYNLVLQIKENDPEVYNNIGGLYSLLNEPQKAEHYFKKAIQFNTVYPEAHINIARIYYNQENYDEAIKEYSLAIDQKNDYEIAYLERAAAYNKLEQYQSVLNDLNAVIKINPNNIKALKNIENIRRRGVSFE